MLPNNLAALGFCHYLPATCLVLPCPDLAVQLPHQPLAASKLPLGHVATVSCTLAGFGKLRSMLALPSYWVLLIPPSIQAPTHCHGLCTLDIVKQQQSAVLQPLLHHAIT